MLQLSPVALRWSGAALLAVAARWSRLPHAAVQRAQCVPLAVALVRHSGAPRLLAQVALAVVDVVAAGLALWALLPHAKWVS